MSALTDARIHLPGAGTSDDAPWASVPAGESGCDGLLITPHVTRDEHGRVVLLGGWRITHRASGLALTGRVFDELAHAVLFTQVLAAQGVDFATVWVSTDPAAAPALRATTELTDSWIAQDQAA